MAAIKLKIVVDHLDNVMLEFDKIKVYRSTTGRDGAYSEITGPATRPVLSAGTTLYEFIDSSGDPDYWYKFSFYNSSTSNEGSLSEPLQGTGRVGVYCTIQDLRDEGVSETLYSDTRVNWAIELASRFIEQVTGRWFEPRTRTFRIRGRNTKVCFLPHPVVSISTINLVSGRGSNISRSEISVNDVLVFNRHLTEGLFDPDDRDTPRMEYDYHLGIEYPGIENAVFPWASQVVEVTGRFGYTELSATETPSETSDGSQVPSSEGTTPMLIEKVCKLLAIRELAPMGDVSDREASIVRSRITMEKTADQSYQLANPGSVGMQGYITGDQEIDSILVKYLAPAQMAAI